MEDIKIMRKANKVLALILAGSIFLAGCGNGTTDQNSNGQGNNSSGNVAGSSEAGESSGTDQGDQGTEGQDDTGSGDEGQGDKKEDSSGGETPQEGEDAQRTPLPSPDTHEISPSEDYKDSEREVTILGLKEYKKLKSKRYTDKAKKGKKFLVLFLSVRNNTDEKEYFHVDFLHAKIDGKEKENTVLLNEPEGYPTMFSNIMPQSHFGGFIVWEVPENWKKLEVSYEGWRDSDGLILNSTLTKKDLKDPKKYDPITYDQSE